jgi:YVTN family beta-propeller protein
MAIVTQSSRALLVGLFACVCAANVASVGDSTPSARPGPLGGGVTLLPNGWKIAPAGRHVPVGHLPLSLVESADGRSLFVATNGFEQPAIVVVDPEQLYVRGSVLLDHAWLGLAWHPGGDRLYVSGGGNATIHELRWAEGRLTRTADLAVGRPFEPASQWDSNENPMAHNFVGGVAVSPDGDRLYAVDVVGQTLSMVDLASGRVTRTVSVSAEPYTVTVSHDGDTVFVSLWGGAKVLMFDAWTLEVAGTIPTGEHPNAMALAPGDDRLFVACANTNAVSVIDVDRRRVVEQIGVAMFPDAPPGSTPNSVSLSPDGRQLLVANADNNVVALVDVSKPGAAAPLGFIPTGWYPTAAIFSHDGKQIYVLSGKGLTSSPNPRFTSGRASIPGGNQQYSGALLGGTLSVLPVPSREALEALTKLAYSVTPYADQQRLAPANAPVASPIPKRVGDPSPIKHVFYVIRENRTYDQVLGDLDRGNGDPTLTLFGETVTPNAHALAREFGVLDNFYVNAEVSYDGHEFSMAAYASDAVQKLWPTNYARRGALYIGEGGSATRTAYGTLAAPANGYIWDACVRANVSVRSYGEFAQWAPGVTMKDKLEGRWSAVASVPGLQGRVNAQYAPWELQIPDNPRVDVWKKEFEKFDADATVPALSIIRLSGDHTNGTRTDRPTPRAMVAENDLALGRIVEAISHSRVWSSSAIFVVEDDAQNGPDHVDAHRSILVVISPFSRRRSVDSTMYTTAGMLRTMELILGLAPMSQYDAAATPLYNAFQATPTATPFTHLSARVSIDEKNPPAAWGAGASRRMDFSAPDRAPEGELNEILWRSIRGADSNPPPVVRRAFMRTAEADPDDQ